MKSLLSKFILVFTLVLFGIQVYGQKKTEPATAVLISPNISIQFPGGAWSENFGTFYTVGLGGGLKTKANWVFSGNLHFGFGNSVKNPEALIGPMLSENGQVFGQSGNYAQVNILQRVLYGLVEGAYIFDQWGVNRNSGPSVSLGVGYVYHWIEYDNIGNDAPQILSDYKKGYDQLRGGYLLKQSVGYTYLSKNRRINFRLSFEIMEAWTENLRGFNYSTGRNDEETQLDLMYGIRLNWYLPIYRKSGEAFYYD